MNIKININININFDINIDVEISMCDYKSEKEKKLPQKEEVEDNVAFYSRGRRVSGWMLCRFSHDASFKTTAWIQSAE